MLYTMYVRRHARVHVCGMKNESYSVVCKKINDLTTMAIFDRFVSAPPPVTLIAITWRFTWRRTTIKNRSSARCATGVTARRPRSRRTCKTITRGQRNGPTRRRSPARHTSVCSARRYSASPTSCRSVLTWFSAFSTVNQMALPTVTRDCAFTSTGVFA